MLYVLYLIRTLWFSLKCLERKAYFTINYNTYNKSDENYLKSIIVDVTNIINKNHKVINEKVDNMVMAQEYLKRAIFALASYPLLYGVIYLTNKTSLTYFFCNLCH